jgi:hypothetical protein
MAQLARIGCIANPMAGKDIRRLVSHSSRIDNQEKVNIIRRILLALERVGVEEALLMPDTYRIGLKALQGIQHALRLRVRILDMDVRGAADDSLRATHHMREAGVQCLVVLGGDGTHRAVSKASGPVPLVRVSTGTNNVFPQMLEGTVAGLAAGFYARYGERLQEAILPTKRLEIWQNGGLRDIALVDIAVSDQQFVGARALWEIDHIRELFLTQGMPCNIGLSSIGGWANPVGPQDDAGLHLMLGEHGVQVQAPIAPGLFVPVSIRQHHLIAPGARLPIQHVPGLLALDGERELLIRPGEQGEVVLTWDGPKVLDVERTLREAQRQGL